METAIGRIELGLETLNPPTRRLSGFSSFPSRRSHLDSASYRSLVRIFSHCLDRSLAPPLSPPKASVTSSLKDLTLTAVGTSASPNVEASSEMELEGHLRADGPADTATAAELVGIDLDDFDPKDGKEMEASVNSEMLSRFMADCGGLIDTPKGELRSGGQAGPDEIADIGLMTTRNLVHGAEEGISSPLGGVCGHFKENISEERVQHAASKELGDPVSCEPLEGIVVLEKPILVEAENVSSRVVEEKGEVTQGVSDVHSNSLLDSLGLINLEGDQASVLAHQTDGGDIEEGEIPDDFQNLEDMVNTVDEEVVLDDKMKEGPSGDDFNEVISTIIAPYKKEVCKHGAGDGLFIAERKGAYVDYEVSLHDA